MPIQTPPRSSLRAWARPCTRKSLQVLGLTSSSSPHAKDGEGGGICGGAGQQEHTPLTYKQGWARECGAQSRRNVERKLKERTRRTKLDAIDGRADAVATRAMSRRWNQLGITVPYEGLERQPACSDDAYASRILGGEGPGVQQGPAVVRGMSAMSGSGAQCRRRGRSGRQARDARGGC